LIYLLNLLLLGFAAALFTTASERQLFDVITYQKTIPILFNFFATICSYALMRARLYLHPGEKPSSHNPTLQLVVIVVSAILAMYYFLQLNLQQNLKVALVALVSGAYFLPIVKTKNGWKRLRDFYQIKHLVVGAMWALATVLLVSRNYAQSSLWILFFERLFFVASLSLLFDHRDLLRDTNENHQTLVKKKGWKVSQRFSFLLMLLAAFATLYLPIEQSITVKKLLVIGLSSICIQFTKPESPDWWYNIVMESLMLLFALVTLF
jgi:hypothetical protein